MKYKVNKNLILQVLDNNLVGFDINNSYLFTFNEVAEYIFKKIKIGWEEEKIISTLATRYKKPLSPLKKDVKKTIKDMIKYKIISTLK